MLSKLIVRKWIQIQIELLFLKKSGQINNDEIRLRTVKTK